MHHRVAPPRGRALILSLLVAGLVLGVHGPVRAAAEFRLWLDAFKQEARAAGIRPATLENALAGVEPVPRIVELDRKQPEGRLTFVEYRRRVVSDARIEKGRRLLREHEAVLAETEKRYGVPAEVIVALWGIESSFGEFKGRFPVVTALATLAHDGRRADFFKGELISALKIIDGGDITAPEMFGSWAGAMGQSQFMPSTYVSFAVDADGDGRRDIWTSLPDIFASMANYLSRSGWDRRYIWGREVSAGATALRHEGLDDGLPLARWGELGVRRPNGGSLPKADIEAWLVAMDDAKEGGAGPTYLVYENFQVLLRWNRSRYFATSVGLLADRLRAEG